MFSDFSINFKCLKIKRKLIDFKPGETIIFRQDLIHAGASYESDNIRLFGYADLKCLKRLKDATTKSNICSKQLK